MVRPGDTQVFHTIDKVVPHVDEVVLLTVDLASKRIKELLGRLISMGRPINLVEVNSEKHPELYFKDMVESYSIGAPLSNEVFGGPFTEKLLISDWSKVRNLGWKRCRRLGQDIPRRATRSWSCSRRRSQSLVTWARELEKLLGDEDVA